jgi:hypothetical protein
MVTVKPPVIRKLICPKCGRHLGETDAPVGTSTVIKCGGCNKWRMVTIGNVVR